MHGDSIDGELLQSDFRPYADLGQQLVGEDCEG